VADAKGDVEAAQRRTGMIIAGGLMLLVFGFTIALTLPTYVDRNNPFWVVGMLVIFGGALSLIAVVFSWLGLGSRDEAFGLPSGSVRTLLAIGVMILFAVFGLAATTLNDASHMRQPSEQPIGTAVAPAATLVAEVQRYERQGLVAVVERIEGGNAVLRLHREERTKPAETTDMQKQLLTALVTLLTSVISFYFGSRSAEAAQESKARAGSSSDDLAKVEAGFKEVDDAIADSGRRLAALQSEAAAPGSESALAAALAQLGTMARSVAEARAALDTPWSDARAGRLKAGAVSEKLAALQQQVQALAQQLRDAEGLVAKG
jgi:hypothetical protein